MRVLVLASGLMVVAGGCGDAPRRASAPTVAARASSAECATRRLPHKFGEAALSGVPERIVPVSFRDQDALLALGEIPVAVQDGFYDKPYLSWPWVRDRLGGARPEVLAIGQLNFEQISSLRPDLVLGSAAGLSEEEYAILSQVAPTVAQLEGYTDFGVPWQETLRVAGHSLCRQEDAEEHIARLEGRIAEVRRENPVLEGATAVVAMAGGPEGSFWTFGPQDSRGRFLASLGLQQPAELDEIAVDRFFATISAERMDLLDADVLVWIASPEQRAALEANPIYRQLDVVRGGRAIYLQPEGLFTAAITNTTALNLPFLLDNLVPKIVNALGTPAPGGTAE